MISRNKGFFDVEKISPERNFNEARTIKAMHVWYLKISVIPSRMLPLTLILLYINLLIGLMLN